MSFKDGHHIVNNRLEWTLRPEAKALRDTPSLIPKLDRDVHNEIHANCPGVPLLGFHALKRTLSEFYPTRDTLSTMDNLMSAIEIAAQHPRAHQIEKELAHLTIQAVDLQRPYIADYFNTRAIL